jgi:hypothetical protein
MTYRRKICSLTEKKMFRIAERLDDLNLNKVVKCGRQNNFGHATVKKIFRGCSVRVHHNFDNSLSLDLLISPSALEKQPLKCQSVKNDFLRIFTGETKENNGYIIPSRKDEPHYRLWVDITNREDNEIFQMLDNIDENS